MTTSEAWKRFFEYFDVGDADWRIKLHSFAQDIQQGVGDVQPKKSAAHRNYKNLTIAFVLCSANKKINKAIVQKNFLIQNINSTKGIKNNSKKKT
jgi:hypothetical protein